MVVHSDSKRNEYQKQKNGNALQASTACYGDNSYSVACWLACAVCSDAAKPYGCLVEVLISILGLHNVYPDTPPPCLQRCASITPLALPSTSSKMLRPPVPPFDAVQEGNVVSRAAG
jgi:hypothetical protein